MKTMRITESNGKVTDILYNDKLPNEQITQMLLKIYNLYPMDSKVSFIKN